MTPFFDNAAAWGVFAIGCWTLFSWALSAGTRVSNWLENRQNLPESTAQIIAAGVAIGIVGTIVFGLVVWIVARLIHRWF